MEMFTFVAADGDQLRRGIQIQAPTIEGDQPWFLVGDQIVTLDWRNPAEVDDRGLCLETEPRMVTPHTRRKGGVKGKPFLVLSRQEGPSQGFLVLISSSSSEEFAPDEDEASGQVVKLAGNPRFLVTSHLKKPKRAPEQRKRKGYAVTLVALLEGDTLRVTMEGGTKGGDFQISVRNGCIEIINLCERRSS